MTQDVLMPCQGNAKYWVSSVQVESLSVKCTIVNGCLIVSEPLGIFPLKFRVDSHIFNKGVGPPYESQAGIH